MLSVIRLSLWNTGSASADELIYEEMRKHALIALPANVLSSIKMPAELREKWEKDIYQQIRYYCNYVYLQNALPITVPYVILKGTSAAQYYPYPKFRSMGDIDIITKRDGFDDLIINNINDSHVLPDMINGLVLIEHINQHIEEGLGLRQIIDWMMFVDKCLPDNKWVKFEEYAQKAGLKTLAVTITRMCEMYLGLNKHMWCASADEELCTALMDYILTCGNFGTKISAEQKTAVSRAIELNHPIRLIKELQSRGENNWKAAVNPLLRPFAWMWQGLQFAKNTQGVIEQYGRASRLDTMFDKLGVKRSRDGIVYYKDDEYYKK